MTKGKDHTYHLINYFIMYSSLVETIFREHSLISTSSYTCTTFLLTPRVLITFIGAKHMISIIISTNYVYIKLLNKIF